MQSIILEDRKKLSIIGATKVESSTESQAVVELDQESLVILGSQLEITKLNLENKEVIFSGNINSIKFSQKNEKKSLLKRIFK